MDILLGDNPTLSSEEVENWQRAIAHYNNILSARYQAALSMFNLQIFTDLSVTEPIDLYEIENDVMGDYFFHRPDTSNISITGVFNHVAYPATYYGYLWSEVIAEDIAHYFRQTDQGLMNAKLGSRLRDIIYTNYYDSDAATDIEWFLGRPWNSDAYYHSHEP
jgi:Zn-dependent oligopeptidase